MDIKFEHTCHVDGVKFEGGTTVDEKSLPEEWLKGALKHKFVSRVPATKPTEATGTDGDVTP